MNNYEEGLDYSEEEQFECEKCGMSFEGLDKEEIDIHLESCID